MSAVVDVIEDVVEGVGDVVEEVGDAVEDVADFVVETAEDIGEIVETVVENYGVQIVLMAAGVPPAVAAGVNTLANGGSIEDALKTAATSVIVSNVNANVYNEAIKAGFSVTESAAIASAASSAVATTAAGGDAEDILKASVIGAAASAAGNVVKDEFGRDIGKAAESIVRDTLKGADFKDAIINATASVANTYANDYANSGGDVSTDTNQDGGNTGGGVAGGDVEDQEGGFYGGGDGGGGYVDYGGGGNGGGDTGGGGGFGGGDQYASVDTGTMTDAGPEAAPPQETFKVGQELEYFKIDENFNIVDKETGEIVGQVPEDRRDTSGPVVEVISIDGRPVEKSITNILDLRQYGGDPNSPREALIGGGGYAQSEGGVLPFSFFGQDTATGDEKYYIFDKVYTAITLPNGDLALKSDTTNQVYYPTVLDSGELKLTETTEGDINSGNFKPLGGGEGGGGGGGGGGMSADEMDELDRQIADLEKAVAEAEDEAQAAASRQKFVTEQRERLSDRLSGETRSAIDAEISMLISQYERAREAAERGRSSVENIRSTERGDELTGILGDTGGGTGGSTGTGGTGTGTGGGTGSGTGTGIGTGTGTGGGSGAGSGTGAGTGSGMGDGTGGGTGGGTGTGVGEGGTDIPSSDNPIITTTTFTTPEQRFVRTVSPRVTGEALAGILGAKKPLFGGDEDAQRAIWNRRSLRLRRALGL